MARSLANTIVRSSTGDPSQFTMIVGIGDSMYFSATLPSWSTPVDAQDHCYFGVQQPLAYSEFHPHK
jgi:hypothetical protein